MFHTHGDGLCEERRDKEDEECDHAPAVPGQGLREGRVVEGLGRVLHEQLLVALRDREVEVHGLAPERRDRELGRRDVDLTPVQLA